MQALTGAQSLGGLVGRHDGGGVTASYARGAVATSPGAGGLTGTVSRAGAFSASYWDTAASGRGASGGGAGFSTSVLQAPTSATGIYATWDQLDLDGDGDPSESPWHFGSASQYPVLEYGGLQPSPQSGDYDSDDDGLIEIRTLAQLNAVRWDLDGNGAPTSGNATAYAEAFPNHLAGMGCPTTPADSDAFDCLGYELDRDLDYDSDGDGDVDGNDPNSYANWSYIGASANSYTAIFEGNRHSISNLTINGTGNQGLFYWVSGAIRNLGLKNVDVRTTNGHAGALVYRLLSGGALTACWSSGSVSSNRSAAGLVAYSISTNTRMAASFSAASIAGGQSSGGLAGRFAGSIVASYAIGPVSSPEAGGLVGTQAAGTVRASYSTGRVTGGLSNGLIGRQDGGGSGQDNYWDTQTSGKSSSVNATGKTTSELQTPTSATGIYANWDDLDVNGNSRADEDPWNFGTDDQYPVLEYAAWTRRSSAPTRPASPVRRRTRASRKTSRSRPSRFRPPKAAMT